MEKRVGTSPREKGELSYAPASLLLGTCPQDMSLSFQQGIESTCHHLCQDLMQMSFGAPTQALTLGR